MGNFYMDLRQNNDKPVEKNPLRTRSISDIEERVLEMNEQLEKLLLVNAALYDVIKERLGVTDEEIANKINNLTDKNLLQENQRHEQVVRKCRKCGKNLIQRRSLCVYCGTENDK